MKDNVDLTLDRDFANTRGNKGITSITDLFLNVRYIYIYPWNEVYFLVEEGGLGNKEVELVHTGNATERKTKKLWDKETGERWLECDRCGAYIKEFPWDMNLSSLCKSCDEFLKTKGDRIPWRGSMWRT